jgi:hypothetical protein
VTARTSRGLTVTARAWLWLTVALTGSAFVLAVALAPTGSPTASPGRALAWVLFVGSSVHVASTGWLYSLRDVRSYAVARPTRYLWLPLALMGTGAVLAAALPPPIVTWLLLPFFGWQFFHFAKQNLGMVALAASSSRVPSPSRAERRALLAAGLAGIGGLLAHPALLQLPVDSRLGPLFPLCAAAFGIAQVAGAVLLLRRPAAHRPAGFCAMYLIALLFSLPVFVFASPYAAVSGMTIAHGMQYLLLMALVAAGPSAAPVPAAGQVGRAPASAAGGHTGRIVAVAILCNVALLGGIALEKASHLHGAGPVGRLLFGAYLGAVMAHFVIDAGMWRLRDPFPRALLIRRIPYLVKPDHGRGGVPMPAPPEQTPSYRAGRGGDRGIAAAIDRQPI